MYSQGVTSMKYNCFLDTTILVYFRDASETKQAENCRVLGGNGIEKPQAGSASRF